MSQVPQNNEPLLAPEQTRWGQEFFIKWQEGVTRVIYGQDELVEMVLIGISAGGNLLLEGLPGLGKTELIKTLSELVSLPFKRVQFTPDLMPGDITGTRIFNSETNSFDFHPGPVFTSILLADEINRASPKTQASLLEAMQEKSVTLYGETRKLPEPFFVLASQNPIELEGTYPLPEAQQDRFLFKLKVPGVDSATLEKILLNRGKGDIPPQTPLFGQKELLKLQEYVNEVYLPKSVASFISKIIESTHPHSPFATPLVKKFIRFGASPRGALAILRGGKSLSLYKGKVNLGFDEVEKVAPAVLNHRLILDYRANLEGVSVETIIAEVLKKAREGITNHVDP